MGKEITLEQLQLEINEHKQMDLRKKLDIALNIKKSERNSTDSEPCGMTVHQLANLTGVTTSTISKISEMEEKSISFNDWLQEQEVFLNNNYIYKHIRTCLMVSFALASRIPTEKYLIYKFGKNVLNKFYTPIQLPGVGAAIYVEKPEIVLKRHRYLYTKLMYQELDKNIVYVEAKCIINRQGGLKQKLTPSADEKSRLIIAVSPKYGYVGSLFFRNTDKKHLVYCMAEHIIPKLPPSSVVVFDDNVWGDVNETPGMHVPKKEMISWLQDNEIPHDPNTHRADLFALIETYKKSSGVMTRTEEIVKASGHIFLRREEGPINFDCLNAFWNDVLCKLKDEKTCKSQLPYRATAIASSMGLEYWQELDSNLRNKEINTYREDLEMEVVIDKLMTMIKYKGVPKSCSDELGNLDNYCKAMSEEYIFNASNYYTKL